MTIGQCLLHPEQPEYGLKQKQDPEQIEMQTTSTGQITGAIVDPEICQPYEIGARGEKGRAAFILRPNDIAEASRLVAEAVNSGIRLIPQGANTGLVAGSVPDETGAQGIISTDRLRSTLKIDPVERTATVSAGIRLSEVNAAAAAHGLYLPIDLGADPMIGGMVATNTGGARFLRHGDMRRRTLGLTVVLPEKEGSVLTLGGLRKDASGPDWKQIFIGTGGSFGLIAEAVLELANIPKRTATALLVPGNPDCVTRLLVEMEQTWGEALSAFELMSAPAIDAALSHAPAIRNPFPGKTPDLTVLIEVAHSVPYTSDERSLDALFQDAIGDLWERDSDLITDAVFGPPEKLWALRHALPEGVKKAGRLFAFDLSFRRSDLMTFRTRVIDELVSFDAALVACDFGHVGDGGLHLDIVLPRAETRPPDYEFKLRNLVVDLARQHGGSFSAEHGLGAKNQHFYDAFEPVQNKMMALGLQSALGLSAMGSVQLFGED